MFVCLFVCLRFTCVCIIYILCLRFESYVSTQEHSGKPLTFPSVSICPLHITRSSVMKHIDQELSSYQTGGMDALLNETDHDPLILKPMTSIASDMYLTSEELFKYCNWQGEKFDCQTRIKSLLTPGRICYTVDSRIEALPPLTGTIPGEEYGMTILLDIHQEEHAFNSYDNKFDAGVKLLVHSPTAWALTEEKGVVLAPGFSHYIGMTYKEVRRLSTPYAKNECVDDESYEFGECITGCSLHLRFERCNCSNVYNCSYLEISSGCYAEDIKENFITKCSHCKRNCKESIYDVHLSSAMLPAQNSIEQFINVTGINRTTVEDIRKNIVMIKLYFISMHYEETTHKPSFDIETLFANIGGFLGLFVGASVMTVLEVIELICHLLHKCFTKYCKMCSYRRSHNCVS